jgi:hypothetical protein
MQRPLPRPQRCCVPPPAASTRYSATIETDSNAWRRWQSAARGGSQPPGELHWQSRGEVVSPQTRAQVLAPRPGLPRARTRGQFLMRLGSTPKELAGFAGGSIVSFSNCRRASASWRESTAGRFEDTGAGKAASASSAHSATPNSARPMLSSCAGESAYSGWQCSGVLRIESRSTVLLV